MLFRRKEIKPIFLKENTMVENSFPNRVRPFLYSDLPHYMSEDKKIKEGFINNGTRFVTRSVYGVPNVEIELFIEGAGSQSDVYGHRPLGTAHFLDHMCLAESFKYNYYKGSGRILELLGYYNVSTSSNDMRFFVGIPRKNLFEALDIFIDHVHFPLLMKNSNIEKERANIYVEYGRDESDIIGKKHCNHLNQTLYPNQKFLFPVTGISETIREITGRHLKDAHEQNFLSSAATLLVQGDISHEEIGDYWAKNMALPRGKNKAPIKGVFIGADCRFGKDIPLSRVSLAFPLNIEKTSVMNSVHDAVDVVLQNQLFEEGRKTGSFYDVQVNHFSLLKSDVRVITFDSFPQDVERVLGLIANKIGDNAQRKDFKEFMPIKEFWNNLMKSQKYDLMKDTTDMMTQLIDLGRIVTTAESIRNNHLISDTLIQKAFREDQSSLYALAVTGKLKGLPTSARVAEVLRRKPAQYVSEERCSL